MIHPNDRELASLCAGLAHGARAHLLRVLVRRGECTSQELERELPLAQSTISRHLTLLREAGLITSQRSGRHVQHRVDAVALRRLTSIVAGLAAATPQAPPRPR